MKHIIFLITIFLFISCKDQKKETINPVQNAKEVAIKKYPKNLSQIFEAHGGLEQWNTFQLLEFTIDKPTGEEVTLTNLQNRKSLISTDKFKIGYNGKDVWIAQDSLYYKGKPRFYYNLMFYFYAMPFILADDGIIYSNAEPLIFEGKTYPGIKIAYQSGVGESPEDEYILYYDANTNKMTWLAYTVTFLPKKKLKNFIL